MTDTEIIKALECCVFKTTDKCDKCILTRYGNDCKKLGVYALDLINRQKELIEKSERVEHFADKTIATLQAEIDKYAEEQHELMIEKDNLFDIAEKQKAEIERLEGEIDKQYEQAKADILGIMVDGGTSCHWCIEQHKAEAVKEFAERLKKEIDIRTTLSKEQDKNVLFLIDSLLKETVGGADDFSNRA